MPAGIKAVIKRDVNSQLVGKKTDSNKTLTRAR